MISNWKHISRQWIWVTGSAPAKEDTGVQEAIEESAEFCTYLSLNSDSIK